MAKRRTRIDIISDILMAIQQKGGRIKPTHLLYKANLSYQLLSEYLAELRDKELVDEEVVGKKQDKKEILLTDKGYDFLDKYHQMKQFQESFGL
ncbi:winged helix-turn-helix transcriptional regulator [Candidatus Woesearchaeota archaeon]|nr:winged helix-turn-helix transcriptional regulator [Candidatus Woesearchaeota archaeon]